MREGERRRSRMRKGETKGCRTRERVRWGERERWGYKREGVRRGDRKEREGGIGEKGLDDACKTLIIQHS